MTDLILLHPPSIYHFRELPCFLGPISDVIPSTSIFEGYPIGFLTLSEYLTRHGMTVRIVNLALKMLRDPAFDAEAFTAGLKARAFGVDLHWLPHVDGCLSLAAQLKRQHPAIPVIVGGLSATYFCDELMRDYPEDRKGDRFNFPAAHAKPPRGGCRRRLSIRPPRLMNTMQFIPSLRSSRRLLSPT